MFWKDDFFKSENTYTKLQNSQRIRETWCHLEDSKLSVTDPKKMEIYKLPAKEFKIIILKILKELQENRTEQFNTIKKQYKSKMRSSTKRSKT